MSKSQGRQKSIGYDRIKNQLQSHASPGFHTFLEISQLRGTRRCMTKVRLSRERPRTTPMHPRIWQSSKKATIDSFEQVPLSGCPPSKLSKGCAQTNHTKLPLQTLPSNAPARLGHDVPLHERTSRPHNSTKIKNDKKRAPCPWQLSTRQLIAGTRTECSSKQVLDTLYPPKKTPCVV